MKKSLDYYRDRELNILEFIWLLKLTTMASLHKRFFKGTSLKNSYKTVRRLHTRGFIKSIGEPSGGMFALGLTGKGFNRIKEYLPLLKVRGISSDCPKHDLLVNSVHFNDLLLRPLEHLSFFTEQQIKCYHEDNYPDWVPKCDYHRPDGYWKVSLAGQTNIIGLEVEISRKKDCQYEGIAMFYNDLETVTRVLWLVKSKRFADKLDKIMNKPFDVADQKHNFILEKDYYQSLWQTRIIVGPEKTEQMRGLLGLREYNCGEESYYSPFLEWVLSIRHVYLLKNKILKKNQKYRSVDQNYFLHDLV